MPGTPPPRRTAQDPLRILIVDDHPIVRRGLKGILEEQELTVVGEAENGREGLDLVAQVQPDVVLLDLNLPGLGGLEVLERLRHDHPSLPVLIISVHPEEQYAVRALRGGASGYLSKDSTPAELVQAIRKVCAGGRYVTASLAELLAFELGGEGQQLPHETLSHREFQVLQQLGAGRTVTEIGKELHLSVKTVSTYRSRILEKLGLHTTAELIRYAVEHELTA